MLLKLTFNVQAHAPAARGRRAACACGEIFTHRLQARSIFMPCSNALEQPSLRQAQSCSQDSYA